MHLTDTIAAISTPRGKGGVAIIRISGGDAAAILSRIFRPAGKHPVDHPRYASYGALVDGTGEVLDRVLVTYFTAPRSFTGEDVAEISCHGGMLLTEQVLAAVLAAGARPAEAGEFTARAMMNGKMALSEAEALGALLEADTKGRLALARGGMSGYLAEALRGLYTRLTDLLADIYAKVDFPDEDLASLSREELIAVLRMLRLDLAALAATWQTGRAVAEGIETVICGPVNAGKSTLYNALVGHDAAIVTDVAGTTRDILSETVSLGRLTLRLYDTAGLRATDDAVEQIGVDRAGAAMERAELIFAVFDGSRVADTEARALIERLKTLAGRVIVILNKQDAAPLFEEELLSDFPDVLRISAAEREIAPLAALVERYYFTEGLDLTHGAVVANARQFAALERTGEALDRALDALAADIPLDAACVEAELALSALGEVDGRTVDDDIVASIFSHFCVGK